MDNKAREQYEWLMGYVKSGKERFFISDWGCGMTRYASGQWGSKGLILVNEEKREAHMVVFPDGSLPIFTQDDLDMESIAATGYDYDARKLMVDYTMGVDRFRDGVARVHWMLHPDGSYYADEDGFGRQDDDEVWVYAYIDTDCRVLVPFRQMESKEEEEQNFLLAKQRLQEK